MTTYLKLLAGVLLIALTVGCSKSIDSTGEDGNQAADATPTLSTGGVYSMAVDATSRDDWIRLSLTAGVVGADAQWDLAFRRFAIRLNGGGSGTGTAVGQFLADAEFADASQAPDDAWLSDGSSASELVFSDWYSYNGETHQLTPYAGYWLVRAGSGQSFYALQILSYYNEAGDSAVYSLQWKEIDAPASLPELASGTGRLPDDTDNPQSSGGGQAMGTEMDAGTAGAGCYSGPPNHMCDCQLTEDECTENDGVWTGQCECGVAEETEETEETESAASGCYSGPPSHMCDCQLSEDECAANDGVWTEQCDCDSAQSSEDTEASAGDTSQDGAYGCYSGPPTHMCDCQLSEDECASNEGVWTERCDCDAS